MTKSIRIENADTSNHKVKVTAQFKDIDGNWVDSTTHTALDYPTAMTTETIWDKNRLVIEEVPA